MLATLTSADSGRSQLSLRDSGAVPCFARHCQTTSGSANEVSWEGIKSGGRACQRRDMGALAKFSLLLPIARIFRNLAAKFFLRPKSRYNS